MFRPVLEVPWLEQRNRVYKIRWYEPPIEEAKWRHPQAGAPHLGALVRSLYFYKMLSFLDSLTNCVKVGGWGAVRHTSTKPASPARSARRKRPARLQWRCSTRMALLFVF